MSTNLIFLWSCRRVLSTPLHRAIFQLQGIKHFCEPFCLQYYFGENRRSIQFADRQDVASNWDKIPTDSETLANITADYSSQGFDHVFIKEHAVYVYPDKIPDEILSSSTHTFIIRNPEKSVRSLYRQTLADFEESAWDRLSYLIFPYCDRISAIQ